MAANCVEVEPGEPFRLTRQRWAGSLLEEATLDGPVRFLTVAEHVVEPAAGRAAGRTPDVVRVRRPRSPTPTSASRVVGAGRAARPARSRWPTPGSWSAAGGASAAARRSPSSRSWPALLGGAVGVSRVVTSAGWRPHAEQVGQTGTRIAPDLYIACGISGAIQHIVGCKAAKAILAINTDPDAPIMSRASYAVIGDLHTVVPAISAEIRRTTGG